MARTVKEIQDQILTNIAADSVLGPVLNSSSRTSIYRLWSFIVAGAIYIVELLFDAHRADMENLLALHHAHTLSWWEQKAKAFMYGKQPDRFTGQYDTSGMTPEEIEEAMIISYAACTRSKRNSGRVYILVKVAKGEDELEPLSAAEFRAFQDYMYQTGDAGVDLDVISRDADRIKMTWEVYYNPQILDADGNRLDGTGQDVVKGAIREYLKALSFNGVYIPTYHIDHLQAVSGVEVPVIKSVETSSDNGTSWQAVPDAGTIPSAGWCKFYDDADLTLEMIPYNYGEDV